MQYLRNAGNALAYSAAASPASPAVLALQLLAAAGVDQASVEEGLAAQEEAHLVAEFRRNLEYNLGKVGTAVLLPPW